MQRLVMLPGRIHQLLPEIRNVRPAVNRVKPPIQARVGPFTHAREVKTFDCRSYLASNRTEELDVHITEDDHII